MHAIPPLVDIHCHLVPGIDDGAQDWDETLTMARMAAGDGIRTIVVTPHQLGNYGHNRGSDIRQRTAELQQFLETHQVPLEVLPGADVRIESDMLSLLRSGEVLTLADRRRHVLLELPHELYMPLEPVLDELRSAGMVGILSHPERNQGLIDDPRPMEPLVEAGCLMQVTAGSLLGAFGPGIQRLSERFLEQGLVHFISTDAHGTKPRRPLLRRACERVAELCDWETACDLCCYHPSAVAQGRSVPAGKRRVKRRALSSLWRWSKAA